MPNETLYKVVGPQGESIHGGSLSWSLPKDGAPGDWTEVTGCLEICARGLHLTSDPVAWMKQGARVFEVETSDPVADAPRDGDKVCVRRARLVRELVGLELAALRIFVVGRHEHRSGRAWASGSATVEASGSATVKAWGSATVEASGSATVEASGSATVKASDSATVISPRGLLFTEKHAVAVKNEAVWIDRRAVLAIRTEPGAWTVPATSAASGGPL